jgi:flagellar FliJ protein
MKEQFRLKVVQELAQQQSDTAASRLGALNAEAAKAESKLNTLLDYREEYRQRFRNSIHRDVHSAGWKNFQQFLVKLDEAIEQQRAMVLASQQAVHRGQREWQAKQKQVKAYDKLEQRHENAEAERLKRLDQRLMDDLASRAHTFKN